MQKLEPNDRVTHHTFGVGTVTKNNNTNQIHAILVLFDNINVALWNCDGYAPANNGRYFFDINHCADLYCSSVDCLNGNSIYDELETILIAQ
jgi:hypothetical protein